MKRTTRTLLTTLILCQLAFLLPAKADWDPGDPSKWFQLPDLQNGMDVYATANPLLPYNKILADDFLCTKTGPITDIHIWGSWLNNHMPMVPGTTNLIAPVFHFSIHADIPRSGTNYSRPGQELWSVNILPTQTRLYANASERFYDPNINQVIGTDTQVWQYNFDLPPALAFVQQVSNVYWLDVQVQPQPFADPLGPYVFGWKTSTNHWNDDAVFADNSVFGGPPDFWRDMHDPATGVSLDMAFVLTTIPEPGPLALLGVGAAMFLARRRNRR